MTAFQIDGRKLRRATEPNDEWLGTPAGLVFLVIGYAVVGSVALVFLTVAALLTVAVPGFALGLAVFTSIVIYGLLVGPTPRRARS